MAIPIVLSDRESLIKSAVTSLASKVVYQNAALLAPIAVDSVLRVRKLCCGSVGWVHLWANATAALGCAAHRTIIVPIREQCPTSPSAQPHALCRNASAAVPQ